MTRALVTGASGFIGGHLVDRLLRRGDAVRCLVRSSQAAERLRQLGAEPLIGDVTDGTTAVRAVADVDVVYHAAGLTSSWSLAELERVNAGGAATVAAACAARSTPPVLVYVSSIAASGPCPRGTVRVERDPARPVSRYGLSKRLGELATAARADRTPTTIVRPGIVFGPGNRELLPMFKSIHQFRLHASPGFVAPRLSYIDVGDLVGLLIAAAERGRRLHGAGGDGVWSSAEGVYFATADEHLSYAEFGKLVGRALGVRPFLVLPLSFPFPWIAAGVSELAMRLLGRSTSFNLDKIREAVEPCWACSGEAARRDLGFAPSASLAEQLRATADWYRQAGWL